MERQGERVAGKEMVMIRIRKENGKERTRKKKRETEEEKGECQEGKGTKEIKRNEGRVVEGGKS